MEFSLNTEKMEDYPGQLLKEFKNKKIEKLILEILEKLGHADLDSLILNIYLKSNQIIKRQTLVSKLHRMRMKNIIYSPKKGFYALKKG